MTSLDFGPLVLGGNVFGWTADLEQSRAVLDAFVAGGGRSVDTADVYSEWVPGHVGGESETVIGQWLSARGRRDDVEIHTKVSSKSDRKGLGARTVVLAAEESLKRLQTDHIDLYYAHRDDPEVAPEEYVVAFDALVSAGKVREVGASNFTSTRLRHALDVASREGLTGFTVSQDQWNLLEREIETSLMPTLQERGVVELPYSGLASGFLTGKYRPGRSVDSVRAQGAGRYLERPGVDELLNALDEVAAAHDTSVTAVSLAWLRSQPGVGAPLASARTVEQVQPLLDSAALDLTSDELARLSDVSAAAA